MRTSRRSPTAIALSRHRLRDHTVAERIVAASGLAPPDLVIEAGAGDGRLTMAIARAASRIIAVEIDPEEYRLLVTATAHLPNVQAVLGDFLALPLPNHPYRVVANLPFSLTADVLRHLIFGKRPPQSAHLVVERAAAMRWLGWEQQSITSILAQVRFSFEIRAALRRTDFDPYPARAPVLLELRRREQPLVRQRDYAAFESFVVRGFGGGGSAGRNLRATMPPDRLWRAAQGLGIDLDAGPGAVGVEQWVQLFEYGRGARTRPGRSLRSRP